MNTIYMSSSKPISKENSEALGRLSRWQEFVTLTIVLHVAMFSTIRPNQFCRRGLAHISFLPLGAATDQSSHLIYEAIYTGCP